MTKDSISDKLVELFELHKSGALTIDEYSKLKAKILNNVEPIPTRADDIIPINKLELNDLSGEKFANATTIQSGLPETKNKLNRKIIIAILLLILTISSIVIVIVLKQPSSALKTNSLISSSDNISILQDLTNKWNDCLMNKDFKTMAALYAEQINIYGTLMSKDKAVALKADFLSKYPDFTQRITGDINISNITDKQFKASFPKSSTFKGKTSNVIGYLIIENISGIWEITSESDDVTDRNISKKNQTKEILGHNSCADVAMDILTTSPAYLNRTKGLEERVIKNGGMGIGIGLEGSPNYKTDGADEYSKTYDFSLYESYKERNTVIDRFVFNPSDLQLYEYDVAQDKLTPIEFDRSLLIQFKEICK